MYTCFLFPIELLLDQAGRSVYDLAETTADVPALEDTLKRIIVEVCKKIFQSGVQTTDELDALHKRNLASLGLTQAE